MQTSVSAPQPDSLALPRYVTVRELAARIARNEFTVYHWLKKAPERLPRVTRSYGRVLFLESDVRDWFDAQKAASTRAIERAPEATQCPPEVAPRKRGRPTKAEQVKRRSQEVAR